MSALFFDGRGFDLSANAAAPLAAWALGLQRRARYEEFGRGPDGFDCLGIVSHVQTLIGRRAPEYVDLYRAADLEDRNAIDALIRAEAAAWRAAEGAPGDVLVLGRMDRAFHVAALCGAGRALHIGRKKEVAIQEIEGRRNVTRFADHPGHLRIYGVVCPA